MTETIIRCSVNVAFAILAYILGNRAGRIEGYREQIRFITETEQELLKILKDQVENSADFINRQQDVLEKINDAVAGRM